MQVHVWGYITKPFSPSQVRARVRQWLTREREPASP
jgi:DNA-binding response OmpR family regulator